MLRCNQHRKVVPFGKAEVVIFEALDGAHAKIEPSQRNGRNSAKACAFDFPGATIAGEAGEVSGGVNGAVGATPELARPGGWGGNGPGFGFWEGKTGGGELCNTIVGYNAWPYCVITFVN